MKVNKHDIENEIKESVQYLNQLLDKAALNGLMIQVISHGMPGRLLMNDLTKYAEQLTLTENEYYLC